MLTTLMGAADMPDDKFGLAAIGKQAITMRKLEELRLRLGLSRNAMAELMHTSSVTYTNWETNPQTRVWPSTAARIGAFYKAAAAELEALGYGRGKHVKLIPFHLAATQLGLPQELLLRWFREGKFEAADLGILGLWITQEEMDRKLRFRG